MSRDIYLHIHCDPSIPFLGMPTTTQKTTGAQSSIKRIHLNLRVNQDKGLKLRTGNLESMLVSSCLVISKRDEQIMLEMSFRSNSKVMQASNLPRNNWQL